MINKYLHIVSIKICMPHTLRGQLHSIRNILLHSYRRYPRVSTDENGRYYRQFDNIMYHKYQPTSQKPACTRSRTYSVIHSSLETIATTQVRPAIPIPTRDEASEGEHDARPHSYCVVNVDDPLMRPNTELGTGGRESPMYAVAMAEGETS